MVLWLITTLMRKQLSGFIFNMSAGQPPNFLLDSVTVLLPFFLWCVSNWCLTTLMDGEGRMKDIIASMGYAVTPLVFGNILVMILSNGLVIKESMYLSVIDGFFTLWTGFLILAATLVIHNYTLSKTVLTCVLTVVVMAAIIFLMLLVFSLSQEIVGFISSIVKEISYRNAS